MLFSRKNKITSRSKNAETVVLILAGYKPFLWDIVFERIRRFAPTEADVCIVSSGLYSAELEQIAVTNNWSYLSTKKNNVCVALNTAIKLFDSAKYIYKIDEDIFVTKNFFANTMRAYLDTKKADAFYQNPIFVSPLIPVNGFSYALVLNYLGLEKEYAARFEPPHWGGGHRVGTDPEVAKFFWGEGGFVPQIDALDEMLAAAQKEVIPCPIHFSIGAILMEREMWEKMGYFTGWKGNGMGADEMQLNMYAVIYSAPMLITPDTCVGHLSFGKQNETMKNYFSLNKKLFEINDTIHEE